MEVFDAIQMAIKPSLQNPFGIEKEYILCQTLNEVSLFPLGTL